ncbi:hypothetical protein MCOR10_009396, partial [Pyricularia oryzae]
KKKKKKKKEKRSWLAMLPYLFFLFCSHRCPGGGPSGFLFFKYHSIHADRAAEATIVPDSQNPLRNAKTETNEPQSPPNGTRGDGETIQEQAKVRTSATRDRGTPLILLHPQHASTRKEHLLTSPAPPLPRGPRLHPYYASLKPPDVKCQSRRIIKAWHFLFFLLCRTEILSSVPEGPMALLNPHIQLGPRGDRRLCKRGACI